MEHVVCGELVDFQEINVGLQFGQFGLQLFHPLFGGRVEVAEAIPRNLVAQIQFVGLMHLLLQFLHLPPVNIKQ
jgi:hypothetical protein